MELARNVVADVLAEALAVGNQLGERDRIAGELRETEIARPRD